MGYRENPSISNDSRFERKLYTIIRDSLGSDKSNNLIPDTITIQQYAPGIIENMKDALKSAGRGKVRIRKIGLWRVYSALN